MDYRDEMEIDLLDLFYYILKKWRILLVFMLIGLILGGVYSVVNYRKHETELSKNAELEQVLTEPVSEAAFPLDNSFVLNKENLTEGEISIANNCVNDYLTYYKNYLNAVEYGNNSIYLNLNFNRVPTMVNSYLIEGYYEYGSEDGEIVSNINNIIGVYDKLLSGSDVSDSILDETKWEVEPTQVRELYKISLKDDSLMTVTVVSDSWSNCKKIMNILDGYVTGYTDQVKALYDYSIELAGQTYSEYADDGVYTSQQSQTNKVNTIRNNMNNAAATLNESQKAYYNAVVKKINDFVGDDVSKISEVDISSIVAELEKEPAEIVETVLEELPVASEEDKAETEVVRKWNPKFFLLGLIAALFVVCLVESGFYVLSPYLKTKDDMSSVFKIMVFGQLFTKKANNHKYFKKVDNFIDRAFLKDYAGYSEDEALQLINSELALSLEANSAKDIYIARCIASDQARTLADKLSNLLTGAGIGISGTGDITKTAQAVNNLNRADYVLLVEKIGETRYEEIAREIELCNKCNKKILGAVVIN